MFTKTLTSFFALIAFCFCLLLSACGSGYDPNDPCWTGGCKQDTAQQDDDSDGGGDSEDITDDSTPPEETDPPDEDGDGFNAEEDCDDEDPAAYPGATEVPDDGIDQDCDGEDATTDPGTTDEYSFEENQECWETVPFDIPFMTIDRSVATLVETDWDDGLNWIDYDPIYILDGSDGLNQVTVYAPFGCGNAALVEGQIDLPVGFEMRSEEDEMYNNGIVVSFQADGTVAEVNYFLPCDDGTGTYEGWILPDGGDYQDACDPGYSSTDWLGAHGGSHTTASQAIRPGDLTSSSPINRPLPIEIDHTHMWCPDSASSGFDCFVGPLAASGDYAALSDYTGSIEGLTMGSLLVLPEGYDCTAMSTTPAERLCEVLRDQFMFVVDDSYGEDEVAFPMEDSVPDEVMAEWGIELHNATGPFASDVSILMAAVLLVSNPEAAVTIE